MISVVKAIVTQVMTNRSNYHTQSIKFVQIQTFLKVSRRQKKIGKLHNIRSVEIIMVLNILFVSALYLCQETGELVLVYYFHQVKVLGYLVGHTLQQHFPPNSFLRLKNIKTPLCYFSKCVIAFLNGNVKSID